MFKYNLREQLQSLVLLFTALSDRIFDDRFPNKCNFCYTIAEFWIEQCGTLNWTM